MIYYNLDKEVKYLEGDGACFLPDDMGVAAYLLNSNIFALDYDVVEWFKGRFGNNFQDKVFVDIGANYGAYTLMLHDYFKHCYAFEPNREEYNILCANAALRGISNKTTLYNRGLSDKNEVIKYMYVDDIGGGNMFIKTNEPEDLSNTLVHKFDGYNEEYRHYDYLQVDRLDDYHITGVGLLKIDVEGFELNVLKGATQTLINSEYPPFFIESWKRDANDRVDVIKAKETLHNQLFDYINNTLGYKIENLKEDNYFCYKTN